MSFGTRLKEKREALGITQPQLAEMLNVSKGAIGNWETDVNSPRVTLLYDLFDILHCDANYLFQDETRELYENEASPEEFENIIKKYRLIAEYSPDGAVVVDTVLDREYAIAEKLREQKEQLEKVQKMDMEVAEELVPKRILAYYGKIAAAGKSYGFDDVIAGTIECPLTDESQRADYAIGVSGDSMEPTFYDGDIVYVTKNSIPEIGDIGIFQKDNGIYIKEVGENELISHNSEYKPIVNNGDILYLGKVVGKVEE